MKRTARIVSVGWQASYACGCDSGVVKRKRDMPLQCAKHGDTVRTILHDVWMPNDPRKRLEEVGARGGGQNSTPRIHTPVEFRDLMVRIACTANAGVRGGGQPSASAGEG